MQDAYQRQLAAKSERLREFQYEVKQRIRDRMEGDSRRKQARAKVMKHVLDAHAHFARAQLNDNIWTRN